MKLFGITGIALVFLFCSVNLNAEESKIKKEEFKMPEDPIIVIETNQGMIELKLFPKIAPKTCENFIRLAESNYYNGVIFHRVIKNFMIQGGDPTGTGRGGKSIWEKPFADEVLEEVQFDRPGLLAMANAGPNTNGSQFFITTVKTPWLNMHHTIFGEVIKGYDVVKKIENCQILPDSKPKEEQKIVKIYLKKIGTKENKSENLGDGSNTKD